jgi:hypothetical protein
METQRTMQDESNPQRRIASAPEEVTALGASWPRPIIAEGYAADLALEWCRSRAAAAGSGAPPFARHVATPGLAGVLFEARRARWLHRSLEEAEKTLAAEQQGFDQAPATRMSTGVRRISRLLIASNDGSARFYREVEKLRRTHETRLEVLILECDELGLGEPVFGPGRTARAVLLDHKTAVTEFLHALHAEGSAGWRPRSAGGAGFQPKQNS